jgi:hypothetical protein
VEYQVIWVPPVLFAQYNEHLLFHLYDHVQLGLEGEDEDEDASLGEEDEGIFREEVGYEPQPTPMQ